MRLNAPTVLVNFVFLAALVATPALHAQQKPATPTNPSAASATAAAAPAPQTPSTAAEPDPALDVASQLLDHVIFLRCFCAGNDLRFDVNGKPVGNPKTTDWTLAAVKLDHAERKGPGEIEVDGSRVFMRFPPDREEFDQHLQKDTKVKLLLAENGNTATLNAALDAIASYGIDPALQRSMPLYWRHYFQPQTPWPDDGLGEKPGVFPAGAPPLTQPAVTHKQSASFTPEAQRDHVTGSVQLHFIVDAKGQPRRIYIVRPLGYGLDERAVDATEKMKFTPGMQSGVPVAAPVSLTQDFLLLPPAAQGPALPQ